MPLERNGVLLPEVPTTEELKKLQEAVKQDEFVESKHGLVTLQQVHRIEHESKEIDDSEEEKDARACKGCKCKKICREKWCGCIKRKSSCSSKCKCGEKCGNPYNEMERGVM